MKERLMEVAERFWSKVDKSGGPDACWPWTAGMFETGYGMFWLDGKVRKTHQVAYELTYGPIPDELNVLHKCDNYSCCNPTHFFIGTHQDNMEDRNNKGRVGFNPYHGSEVGTSKLTDEQVLEIRRVGRAGESGASIARRFGMGVMTICNILHRNTWKHLPEEET
jgi:hypothetical protein